MGYKILPGIAPFSWEPKPISRHWNICVNIRTRIYFPCPCVVNSGNPRLLHCSCSGMSCMPQNVTHHGTNHTEMSSCARAKLLNSRLNSAASYFVVKIIFVWLNHIRMPVNYSLNWAIVGDGDSNGTFSRINDRENRIWVKRFKDDQQKIIAWLERSVVH